MGRDVKLNEIESVLTEVEYPIDQSHAASAFSDVTLVLAEGTENLGGIIGSSSGDEFESVDDLRAEIMNRLPRHAVGEPYQSEGDA